MQAIEFIAQAEDGTIKVPKKYLKNLSGKVRVIILIEEVKEIASEHKKKRFTAFSVNTKELIVRREEANER